MAKSRLQEEIQQTKPFENAAIEAYLNLLRTTDALQAGYRELFRSHGVTEQQYNVLRILRGAGPDGLPCLTIGDRMVTRVPDVTRLVGRLESCGMVTRSRCADDGRVVIVQITREGLAVLERLEAPLAEQHRVLLNRLSTADLNSLIRLLEKARDA